jgi:putative ABC transport system substrate-binding protein
LGAASLRTWSIQAAIITGFQNFETEIGGKWLEVLKEIASGARRVAFVYSLDISAPAIGVMLLASTSSDIQVNFTV